jgi:hypothetical protein
MTLPAVAQSLRGWFRCSALLLLLIVPLAGCDLCGNDVLARYRAPDTSVEVVVFQRDCGATTGFSTQASIGEINGGTGNRPGNIFRAVRGRAPAGKAAVPNSGFGGSTIAPSNWRTIGPLTCCGSPPNTAASKSAMRRLSSKGELAVTAVAGAVVSTATYSPSPKPKAQSPKPRAPSPEPKGRENTPTAL